MSLDTLPNYKELNTLLSTTIRFVEEKRWRQIISSRLNRVQYTSIFFFHILLVPGNLFNWLLDLCLHTSLTSLGPGHFRFVSPLKPHWTFRFVSPHQLAAPNFVTRLLSSTPLSLSLVCECVCVISTLLTFCSMCKYFLSFLSFSWKELLKSFTLFQTICGSRIVSIHIVPVTS